MDGPLLPPLLLLLVVVLLKGAPVMQGRVVVETSPSPLATVLQGLLPGTSPVELTLCACAGSPGRIREILNLLVMILMAEKDSNRLTQRCCE